MSFTLAESPNGNSHKDERDDIIRFEEEKLFSEFASEGNAERARGHEYTRACHTSALADRIRAASDVEASVAETNKADRQVDVF